ncbi:hypothetical protein J6590_005637 [Homalodisca vitripennis]|nr:hypothetical protein J6590_005637 [Homalodisca vitripennis]
MEDVNNTFAIHKGKGDPKTSLCMLNTAGKLREQLLKPRLVEAFEASDYIRAGPFIISWCREKGHFRLQVLTELSPNRPSLWWPGAIPIDRSLSKEAVIRCGNIHRGSSTRHQRLAGAMASREHRTLDGQADKGPERMGGAITQEVNFYMTQFLAECSYGDAEHDDANHAFFSAEGGVTMKGLDIAIGQLSLDTIVRKMVSDRQT